MLFKNQRKLRILVLFFGVLSLSFGAGQCYAQDKPDETKALLKERRDLLSDVANQMNKIYLERRTITLQDVVQADRDSLKADLDWFDRSEDRIQAIEKHKKFAGMLLENAETLVKGARASNYVLLQAKAYFLEIQIELIKEKRKAKPGK